MVYASLTIASVILSDLITVIPVFAAAWLLGTGIGTLALLTVSEETNNNKHSKYHNYIVISII